jgi:hypothetical protein
MGQQLREARDGVRGDAGEDIPEPGVGFDSCPLAGCHEAPQHCRRLATFVAAKEDPVVATHGDAIPLKRGWNVRSTGRTLRGVCTKSSTAA